MENQPKKPHILFLFSDTGGGHRSAAEAIIEALNLEFPDRFSTEMVDIFREYTPPPLDKQPEMYPYLSRMTGMWRLGFRASNGRRRIRMIYNMLWPYTQSYAERLLEEHPADLIVSVHPVPNTPLLRVMRERNIPYYTVVTDLVSTHAFWFNNKADLVIVPTEKARQRGLELGLDEERLRVIGLPVADRFCQKAGSRQALRAKLGWPQDLPVIVLVGGGEGMGPLEKTAAAIDDARLPAALVVIAGRNQKLKARLEERAWNTPTFVYGFVREMPDFMLAADVLVSKAGPGTICEAFIAGLPVVLYSRVPGQEEGNVDYVVESQAGVWAPEPELVADALRNWLVDHPEERERASQAALEHARPNASREIARVLAERLGIKHAVPE